MHIDYLLDVPALSVSLIATLTLAAALVEWVGS